MPGAGVKVEAEDNDEDDEDFKHVVKWGQKLNSKVVSGHNTGQDSHQCYLCVIRFDSYPDGR
jgi:hypothetical protein